MPHQPRHPLAGELVAATPRPSQNFAALAAPRARGTACGMKVFLDDVRQPPPGWTPVRWPKEAIALLQGGNVAELSLDHDLGDDARGTGYDVLLWIEEAVATRSFLPPVMGVHSANPAGRRRMEQAIQAIEQRARGGR